MKGIINFKIEEIESIAQKAWIESFFTKRNSDITGFKEWWLEQAKKIQAKQNIFRSGMKLLVHSTVGSPQSIENAAVRYSNSLNLHARMIFSKDVDKAFVDGANSPEAREFWYKQFLTEQYLQS